MLKNISRKAKSLLHDGPLSSEVEMKYVSDNRQKMMKIIEGENGKSRTGFPGLEVQRTIEQTMISSDLRLGDIQNLTGS